METGEVAREKVCIVTPAYSTIGGTRTMIRQLIRVLSEKYEVTMLSIKWMEEKKRNFVHYDIALSPRLRLLFTPWHVPTILLYQLSGVIWCLILSMRGVKKFFVQEAVVTAFFATIVGKIVGGRVYVFDYGPMLGLYDPRFVETQSKYRRGALTVVFAKLLKIMNRFSLRHCHKFFFYTSGMKECAVENGLDDKKAVSYNFPVDLNVFRPYSSKEREKIREKFGIKKAVTAITFIGRISEDKGIAQLLGSASFLLKKYGERLKFVVVGDGPLVEWVLEKISSYRATRILYLGPVHELNEIADILNASDIFVYPITVSYGYALAALEAMAIGLPVVITDMGPTKELILNEHNGMLIPPEDVESLNTALELLIENEKLRGHIGDNAKKVLTKFSTKAYRKTILTSID